MRGLMPVACVAEGLADRAEASKEQADPALHVKTAPATTGAIGATFDWRTDPDSKWNPSCDCYWDYRLHRPGSRTPTTDIAFPVIDPDEINLFCTRRDAGDMILTFGGVVTVASCLERLRSSYDFLKTDWDTVPDAWKARIMINVTRYLKGGPTTGTAPISRGATYYLMAKLAWEWQAGWAKPQPFKP
jgi:hypothetical protein